MKKNLATLVFSLFLVSALSAQKEVTEYSFVVVPESYSFLNENDQYQLNSLTKFLFNKHGFNAYFNNELPNVGRCDGLWADVELDPGFIWTKMVVVLKDCNDREVFRSFEGRSKLKEYKKLYYEALRGAFESIAGLDVQQPDPIVFTKEVGVSSSNEGAAVADVKISEEQEQELDIEETVEVLSALDTEGVRYVSNGNSFILKETDAGYSLYEGAEKTELVLKGNVALTQNKILQFTDTTGNVFNAMFDSEQNLIIETGFQKVRFTKMD